MVILIALLIFFPISSHAEENGVATEALSLDKCISQALKAHPKISIYSHKAEQKKEKLNLVTAEYLFQIDAVVSYDRLSYVTQYF